MPTAVRWSCNATRLPNTQLGFAVQLRCRGVGRCFASHGSDATAGSPKDFEATIVSAKAFLNAASVLHLIRRLPRSA